MLGSASSSLELWDEKEDEFGDNEGESERISKMAILSRVCCQDLVPLLVSTFRTLSSSEYLSPV
jgi:hypothetical protein